MINDGERRKDSITDSTLTISLSCWTVKVELEVWSAILLSSLMNRLACVGGKKRKKKKKIEQCITIFIITWSYFVVHCHHHILYIAHMQQLIINLCTLVLYQRNWLSKLDHPTFMWNETDDYICIKCAHTHTHTHILSLYYNYYYHIAGNIGRELRFGGLHHNRQIKIRQNFLLAYIHMAILYWTAKFNILAIAILGSTAKFNSRQYFQLYGINRGLIIIIKINVPVISGSFQIHSEISESQAFQTHRWTCGACWTS